MKKFSAQMEDDVLDELRAYAKSEGIHFSAALSAAARQFLQRARVRPAFHRAALDVIRENEELLRRLPQ